MGNTSRLLYLCCDSYFTTLMDHFIHSSKLSSITIPNLLGAHFVYAVPSHASDKFLINSMMTLLADKLATQSNVSICRTSDGHAL